MITILNSASRPFVSYAGKLEDLFNNTNKLYVHFVQNNDDTPKKGNIALAITLVVNSLWGFQIVTYGNESYSRTNQNGKIQTWLKTSQPIS